MGIDLTPTPYYGSADLNYYGLQVNGNMAVSQEWLATSTTTKNTYATDMWQFYYTPAALTTTIQQVSDAPPGYSASEKITITAAYPTFAANDWFYFSQSIEGYRTARLGFGAASASPVSVGFWVKVSLTGTWTLTISGASTYSYASLFTVNVANVWEWKTLTVPGTALGSWGSANTNGLSVIFGLGAGTNYEIPPGVWMSGSAYAATGASNLAATLNATFQITGLLVVPGTQLPTPQTAASIQRPFDEELSLCQRYYEKSYDYNVLPGTVQAAGPASTVTYWTTVFHTIQYKVRKRATPSTVVIYNWNTGTQNQVYNASTGGNHTSAIGSSGERGYTQNAGVATANLYMWHWAAAARL